MLNFLRKHQKIFFIFITTAIVVSFCFFGTYGTMAQPESAPDRELGQGVCGKPIMQHELTALCHLLESSVFDAASVERGAVPNFLNDGVVEKDFLANGLAALLVKRYFEEFKSDLDQRVKKIHVYRPYVHPRSSQISVEAAWARFVPRLHASYQMLKANSDQPTFETAALMCQLYLDQAMLPQATLKQLLAMQQSQVGVTPDPALANLDLRLFGFKSLQDWFGPHFVPLLAQCIINAEQIAREKGYEVKNEEVRTDLFKNIATGYQQVSRSAVLNPEEIDHYYQISMRSLGLSEPSLIHAWKQVMLFRRLFEDGSGSVFVDPLAYQQFEHFAKENVRVTLYQLPHALQLTDFRTMMKLQLYLELLSAEDSPVKGELRLPKQMASLDKIEKRAPELVERKIELQWSTVSKETLSREISIRETWEWEGKEGNWALLQRQFPELGVQGTKEMRLAALNALDETLRMKVDEFARTKMVEGQLEKIQVALEHAPSKTQVVGLKARGGVLPLPALGQSEELTGLLKSAALQGESPNAASERLKCYTADGEHFFSIAVLHRDEERRVLLFDEASREGSLDKILDKRLESAYPDARRRESSSFQQSSGQWKPFKEVKDQVGKYVFADLLGSIEENYRNQFGFLPGKEGQLPLGFYSNARMLFFMQEAQKHLKANPFDSAWVKSEESEQQGLASQWLLEMSEQTLQRCTQTPYSKEEMFTLEAQQWSPVKVGDRGHLAFYFVQERETSSQPPLESVKQGHEILSLDAKRDMMLQLLTKMQQKRAVFFEEQR